MTAYSSNVNVLWSRTLFWWDNERIYRSDDSVKVSFFLKIIFRRRAQYTERDATRLQGSCKRSVFQKWASYSKDCRWSRAGRERERDNETSRIMQEVSVPEMDLHIRKITEGDEQEGKERGTTRLQGPCGRSVVQRWIFISERFQKETSRKGKRERYNETSRTMQVVSVPEMDLHIRKITEGDEQEGKRERDNETSRTMQEVSVPEMNLHIRKITDGDEQKGEERGATRLQGQCKRSVFQRWIFISERLQKEASRKGKREGQRDFKDNTRGQCSRHGSSYHKEYRRSRAGKEREIQERHADFVDKIFHSLLKEALRYSIKSLSHRQRRSFLLHAGGYGWRRMSEGQVQRVTPSLASWSSAKPKRTLDKINWEAMRQCRLSEGVERSGYWGWSWLRSSQDADWSLGWVLWMDPETAPEDGHDRKMTGQRKHYSFLSLLKESPVSGLLRCCPPIFGGESG